jgi:putative ABC transport system ATP-binding protein
MMENCAREQGCTILLVTHNNRILDLADRIVYMEDGHLVNLAENAHSAMGNHHSPGSGYQ